MKNNSIENIKYEKLCDFTSFLQWVNKASSWIGGHGNLETIICLDKNGNACPTGKQFMYARDNDLFPVSAYRLIKNDEYDNPTRTI